jgi:hypothetical protein
MAPPPAVAVGVGVDTPSTDDQAVARRGAIPRALPLRAEPPTPEEAIFREIEAKKPHLRAVRDVPMEPPLTTEELAALREAFVQRMKDEGATDEEIRSFRSFVALVEEHPLAMCRNNA